MRVCTGGRGTGARADRRLLHADRRRPVRLRTDRRGQRAERRLRDGRRAAHGARDRRAAQGRSGRRTSSRRSSAAAPTSCAKPASRCSAATPSPITEIKFGYAITGEIDPARVLTNAARARGRRADPHQAARHGHHRDRARNSAGRRRCRSDAAVESMTRLNRRRGERRRAQLPAGDGQRVHGRHRLRAGRARVGDGGGERRHARIDTTALPAARGRRRAGAGKFLPAAAGRTQRTSARGFGSAPTVTPAMRLVCFDPQTSGGLLLAVDPAGPRRT